MADTQLTQTGAQVQADLDKVEALANIKTIGAGLSLSNTGELGISGGGSGTKLYKHKMVIGTNDTDIDFYLAIVSTSNTPLTLQDIRSTFVDYWFKPPYLGSNIISYSATLLDVDTYANSARAILSFYIHYNSNTAYFVYVNESNAIVETTYTLNETFTDEVTEMTNPTSSSDSTPSSTTTPVPTMDGESND